MKDDRVYSDYLIEIVYDTSSFKHQFYCDYKNTPNERWSHDYCTLTRIYPLIRFIKTKDILMNNTISVHHPILNAYKPDKSIKLCKCGGGDVEMASNLSDSVPNAPILSATVIRRQNAIELD
jgi:hypothetical protein